MAEQRVTINRWKVGIVTVACFVASASVWLVRPDQQMWYSSFLRVGLVMAAVWLAMPGKHREAAWAGMSPNTLIWIGLFVLALSRPAFRPLIPLLLLIGGIGYLFKRTDRRR